MTASKPTPRLQQARRSTLGAASIVLLFAVCSAESQTVSPGQTIFLMQTEESFSADGFVYSIAFDSRFTLMPLNDGSSKFDRQARSSLDLFRLRGGLLGLKPGERLDFYVIEENASGWLNESGQPRRSCKHTLPRNGRFMMYTGSEASLFKQRATLRGEAEPIQYSEVAEATLVRTAQGAILTYKPRQLMCGWENLKSDLSSFGFTKEDQLALGSFVLSEDDLRNWSGVSRTRQGPAKVEADGDLHGVVQYKARLMGSIQTQTEEEMTFVASESYNSWIPAPMPESLPGITVTPPASRLEVTVKIQPKKGGEARRGKIQFVLQDMTRHKGRTGNYPRNGSAKDDLRFAAEQPPGVIADAPNSAHTTEEVSEATVVIEALDTAAWGRLTATAPSLGLKAIYKPTNTYSLTVPRDDDGNKIADAWEKLMKLPPQPNVEADAERVEGQERGGDGMTVLDEYRGLVVLVEGKKVLRRFNPLVKEMFVIDSAGLLDLALWKKMTGIEAYKVDDSMIAGGSDEVGSRVVNSNTSDASQSKYAVRLVKLAPKDDAGGAADNRVGFTECGYCRSESDCDKCQSPKDARSCNVIPDRAIILVNRLYMDLGKAVTDPASKEAADMAAAGIPPFLAKRALDALRDPAARDALAQKMLAQVVVHEVGHAVSLLDHNAVPPKGLEQTVRSCPMYYPGNRAYWRFTVLQILFKADAKLAMQYSEFCRGMASYRSAGYDCFSRINVVDW